jgi:prephenate dehydrogenase
MNTIEQNDEAQELIDALHRNGYQEAARLANIIAKLRADLDMANDECREKQTIIEQFLGSEKAADAAIEKLRAELAAALALLREAQFVLDYYGESDISCRIDNLVAGAQP